MITLNVRGRVFQQHVNRHGKRWREFHQKCI